MAVQKSRKSKSRKGMRRSHHRKPALSLSLCRTCGSQKLPHRICTECGSYKGQEVIKKDISL